MSQTPMSSGQLAKAGGVNVETLRFYERQALLPEPERTASGHRRYGAWAVERLVLIKRAQALGFSLADISDLIQAMDDPRADCQDVCAAMEAKIDNVNRLLARLRARRRRLVRLRDACPRTRPLRECPVVEALVARPVRGRRESR
jgi:DNA-binding transcriptional MerR regulator